MFSSFEIYWYIFVGIIIQKYHYRPFGHGIAELEIIGPKYGWYTTSVFSEYDPKRLDSDSICKPRPDKLSEKNNIYTKIGQPIDVGTID